MRKMSQIGTTVLSPPSTKSSNSTSKIKVAFGGMTPPKSIHIIARQRIALKGRVG